MKHLMTGLVFLALAACAESGANYQPILDGAPKAAFQSDLSDCQTLARDQKQFDQETLGATVLGAGVGAILGDLDSDNDVIGGALLGALAGGVSGAENASTKREAIVRECLRGRGHPVVG